MTDPSPLSHFNSQYVMLLSGSSPQLGIIYYLKPFYAITLLKKREIHLSLKSSGMLHCVVGYIVPDVSHYWPNNTS